MCYRRYTELIKAEGLEVQTACTWPSWQSGMNAAAPFKDAADNSTVIDETCLARCGGSDHHACTGWECLPVTCLGGDRR